MRSCGLCIRLARARRPIRCSSCSRSCCSGTLIDATIIAAAVKPPAFEEGQVNPRDPDASFTKKNGETDFGYKAHLAVDEESGVVRQAEMSSADLHDSQRGLAMIQGDEGGLLRRQGL